MGDGLAGLLGQGLFHPQQGIGGGLGQLADYQRQAMVQQRQQLAVNYTQQYAVQGTVASGQTLYMNAFNHLYPGEILQASGTSLPGSPKAPHADLAWLDKRVDEIRVKL